MVRGEIRELVRSIEPGDSIEECHQSAVLEWIDSGAELCRITKPATPPKHLVSYFPLVDVERQALLLGEHIKAKLWLPPGGHVEPGEHPKDAAHRELKEELNISLPLLYDEPLFLTVTETVGQTAGHTDVNLWFVFKADSSISFHYDEQEFSDMRWFSFSDLPLNNIDPHMGRFLYKMQRYSGSCHV